MTNDFETEIRGELPVDDRAIMRTKEATLSVLSTRQGRRFVYDLLGVCHFGRSSFSGEAVHTASALGGKQLIGEWTMDLILSTYPEAYASMVKEAKEDHDHDRHNDNLTDADSGNTIDPGADGSSSQPT